MNLIDWTGQRSVLPWALTLVAFLFLILGNGSHSLWDRDEPRNATASRNMVLSGDWVVPTFNGELRAHKPILVNWTQGAMLSVVPQSAGFGWQEAAVRFPSAAAGAITIGLITATGLFLGLTPVWAALAGLMTLFSPIYLMVHKAATTDGILIACIWWAVLISLKQEKGFCWYRHTSFSVAVALSVLQKGPVGPLVLLLWKLTRTYGHRIVGGKGPEGLAGPPRWKRWGLLGLIVVSMTSPWIIAVALATQGEFLEQALGRHVVERATSDAINAQGGPFWFYIPVLLIMGVPFLHVLMPGLWRAWRFRAQLPPIAGSLLLWAVLTVGVFSFFATKLPHYILPVWPAWVLAACFGLKTLVERPLHHRSRLILNIMIGCIFICVLAVQFLPLITGSIVEFGTIRFLLWAVLLSLSYFVFMGCFTAFWYWKPDDLTKSAFLSVGFMAVGVCWIFGFVLPTVEPARASRRVVTMAKELAPGLPLAAVGYREPSLVWYYGRDVPMFGRRSPRRLVEYIDQQGPHVVILEDRILREWRENTTATLIPEPIWSEELLNLQSELTTRLHLLVWPQSSPLEGHGATPASLDKSVASPLRLNHTVEEVP